MADRDWSEQEIDAVVADYFHMLMQELAGQAYDKSAHRRRLLGKLDGRSEGSIEFKRRNISAVLIDCGCPYIAGYKPAANYQRLLAEHVTRYLEADRVFDEAARQAVTQTAVSPLPSESGLVVVDAPSIANEARSPTAGYEARRTGVFRDYLERESANRSLGLAGEGFVVEHESRRLHQAGRRELADRVEHASKERGDGLGFDVLSYELDGQERFIEVKTTAFGIETPFFLSRNELSFSEHAGDQYHLYRLFDFRRQPRMFDLAGPVKRHCLLDPVTFRAQFR